MSLIERQLSDTVGPENLLAGPDQCRPYAVHSLVPSLAAAPGSAEELAMVLAAAHEARIPVAPWGGGTRQRLGNPLQASELLVVRTGRLGRVLEYEPDDLTICVEAGITMAALAAALARNGQMLPVDVPLPGRSTLGGALATAADGPRRLGYGTFRDLLIGIRVVEATGRASKAGGRVVKNVSGFDMMKLYLGSLGTLAVIASANFKLVPRPRSEATLECAFPSRPAAFALAEAIQASPLLPAACELFEAGGIRLAMLADGHPAAVARHMRDAARMAEQAGALETRILEGPEHAELWARLGSLHQIAEAAGDELVLRLGCLPSALQGALDDAHSLAMSHGLALQTGARALSGVAYLRARGTDLGAWHRDLFGLWPDLVVLAGQPGPETPVWGQPAAGLEIMRRIKSEMDPRGILNPGRFVV